MRNMMSMMKKVKEAQEKLQKIQEELKKIEAIGSAGGGLVSVTLNGQNVITMVHIDPSLLTPEEAEVLEDLIMAAYNEAKGKIEAIMMEKTQSITAGLPISSLHRPF